MTRQGVTLFLDDRRGLVAFHDDRAPPWICQALERHGNDVLNYYCTPVGLIVIARNASDLGACIDGAGRAVG